MLSDSDVFGPANAIGGSRISAAGGALVAIDLEFGGEAVQPKC